MTTILLAAAIGVLALTCITLSNRVTSLTRRVLSLEKWSDEMHEYTVAEKIDALVPLPERTQQETLADQHREMLRRIHKDDDPRIGEEGKYYE